MSATPAVQFLIATSMDVGDFPARLQPVAQASYASRINRFSHPGIQWQADAVERYSSVTVTPIAGADGGKLQAVTNAAAHLAHRAALAVYRDLLGAALIDLDAEWIPAGVEVDR